MKLVPASWSFDEEPDGHAILARIERSGRVCYKSEDKITVGSAREFVAMLIKRGHFAMLEHGGYIAVRIICDRGVTHEIVRHRIASYAQESTRFCNYSKAKFGSEVTFIDARPHLPGKVHELWVAMLEGTEERYLTLISMGISPQMARSVLPNATKTEIVVTMNPVAWRHFFELRTPETAHPQMREITRPMLRAFRERVPVLFDDVGTTD